MKRLVLPLALATVAALAGCESETTRVDSQLGKSLEHLIQAQTFNPSAAEHPLPYAPDAGDGQRLKNVLDEHRKDVPRGQEHVSQAPVFEVGKQQQ